MVIEKRRILGTMTMFESSLAIFASLPNVHLVPLSAETAFITHTLTAIPDIFERLIVAEASRLNAPLITRDSVISATGLVPTIWD